MSSGVISCHGADCYQGHQDHDEACQDSLVLKRMERRTRGPGFSVRGPAHFDHPEGFSPFVGEGVGTLGVQSDEAPQPSEVEREQAVALQSGRSLQLRERKRVLTQGLEEPHSGWMAQSIEDLGLGGVERVVLVFCHRAALSYVGMASIVI